MTCSTLCGISFAFSLLLCFIGCICLITLFKRVFEFQKVTVVVGDEKRRAFSVAGITVVVSVFLSVLLSSLFAEERFSQHVFFILTVSLLFAVIGFTDDLRIVTQDRRFGIKTSLKVFLKSVLCLAFSVYMFRENFAGTVYFPIFGKSVNLGFFYILFTAVTVFVFTEGGRITNGIESVGNLTSLPICVFFAFLCLNRQGRGDIGSAVICFAVCGTLIGCMFLSKNRFFVDLGNGGTSFISFLIASIAFKTGLPTVLFISCGIWFIQSLCVILNYSVFYLSKKKKKLFKTTPLENHLLLCGVNRKTIILIFATASVILNLVAYILTRGL